MVVYAVGPDGPGYFVSALYTLTGGVAAENFEKDSALSGFAGELFCLWDVKGLAFSTGLRQPFLNLFILMAQFDCHQRGVTVAESANRSEEHTSELQSRQYLVCRLLLEIGRASCRERV